MKTLKELKEKIRLSKIEAECHKKLMEYYLFKIDVFEKELKEKEKCQT